MTFFLGGAGHLGQLDKKTNLNTFGLDLDFGTTQLTGISYFLKMTHEPKVIPNVLLRDKERDAWLLIVGTPILEIRRPEHEIIDFFFRHPEKFMRDEIDGQFSVIAYDGESETLIIASDPNCFIPVFYAQTKNRVLFCSSELVLARILNDAIDPHGFAQAVNLGVTWNTGTRFCHIEKIADAHVLRFDRLGRCKKSRYWSPSDETLSEASFEDNVVTWSGYLKDSIKHLYEASGVDSVSCDFTAGEDSRLIVAACHALKIPFSTRIVGFPDDGEIPVAQASAKAAGFELNVVHLEKVAGEVIRDNILRINQSTDGYGSFFKSIVNFNLFRKEPPLEYNHLHLCGVPGGEVFRGSYYLRAKLLDPNARKLINSEFLGRMKFLLDYVPGFLADDRHSFKDFVVHQVANCVDETSDFPAGTQVDRVLHRLQTCTWGLGIRRPFYLPLGFRELTRSIYRIPPKYKSSGKLTRAATEDMFLKLARTKTLMGNPTIRNSLTRFPLFIPEKVAKTKKIALGAMRRIAHKMQESPSLDARHRADIHKEPMMMLLNQEPFRDWFTPGQTMLTSELFNEQRLNAFLSDARQGRCDHIELLGRIINQELSLRYVKGEL